ncbi:hypothetical protein FI667_g14201, partial [Globisporangium splendens]
MILLHLRQRDPLTASETTPPDNSAAQDTSAGVEVLSAWNRGLLLATIVLFLALSIISGRVLWKQSRRPRANSASNGATSSANANGSNSKGGGLYSTPNNGGASGHNSFSGLPPSVSAAGGATAVASSSTGLLDDESSATLSTGAEMRQRFFLLLFVASSIRVLSLVTEVTTLSLVTAMSPTSLYARLLTMFLWLPSLLFVTMYGLVLLFVAQLCYACWGKAYPWPRRLFFVFNVALYVAFFVLFAVNATAAGYWKACDLVLGSVYFLGLFGILYYSVRLIYFFRNQSPDEDFFFDLPSSAANPRQVVLRRITAVCILLCVLFAIKAVYLVGMGSGLMASEEANYRSPVGVHHIAYEFTMHFTTEFVPGALLIFFTRQSNKPASSELVRATSPATTTLGSSGASGQLNASNSTGGSSNYLKPVTPSYAFRVRNSSQNNSSQNMASHHGYPEDSVPMLSGYQYQKIREPDERREACLAGQNAALKVAERANVSLRLERVLHLEVHAHEALGADRAVGFLLHRQSAFKASEQGLGTYAGPQACKTYPLTTRYANCEDLHGRRKEHFDRWLICVGVRDEATGESGGVVHSLVLDGPLALTHEEYIEALPRGHDAPDDKDLEWCHERARRDVKRKLFADYHDAVPYHVARDDEQDRDTETAQERLDLGRRGQIPDPDDRVRHNDQPRQQLIHDDGDGDGPTAGENLTEDRKTGDCATGVRQGAACANRRRLCVVVLPLTIFKWPHTSQVNG